MKKKPGLAEYAQAEFSRTTRCKVCRVPELVRVLREELERLAKDPDLARLVSTSMLCRWLRDMHHYTGTDRALLYHLKNHEPARYVRVESSRMGRS